MKQLVKRVLALPISVTGAVILKSSRGSDALREKIWRRVNKHFGYRDLEAIRQTRFGAKMSVNVKPRVEKEIFFFGEWEPKFTRYLMERPASGRMFLDIGGNIGYFALLASQKFSKVHTIEASPTIAQRLRDNIARNNADNIQLHEVAVGAEHGEIDFYYDENQSGGSSVFSSATTRLEAKVKMQPLDYILRNEDLSNIGFIKIDIEGSEAPVLRSLVPMLNRLPEDVEIFIEYDPKREREHPEMATWPIIREIMAVGGFEARIMQGAYNLKDYLDRGRTTKLKGVIGAPDGFCDVLLRRTKPQEMRVRADDADWSAVPASSAISSGIPAHLPAE